VKSGFFQRCQQWCKAKLPTRESIKHIRWLRPVAHVVLRPELWRFHRRSVPRGVAIGIFIGIFLMIPGLQIIGAVLVCLPFRGNIPLAAAMTLLSNPITTPLLLLAAIAIGNSLFGLHANIATLETLHQEEAPLSAYLQWLLSDAAPALIGGLAVISLVSAIVGYFVAKYLWEWWIGHKWRHHRGVNS